VVAESPDSGSQNEETLLALVRRRAADLPDKRFMTFSAPGSQEDSMTFFEFAERVAGMRRILRDMGLRNGDRVAIMMKNSLFYPVAWLGVVTGGGTAVPVNSRLGELDARYVLDHSEAKACITDEATVDVARSAGGTARDYYVARTADAMSGLGVADDDAIDGLLPEMLANVQYTSGTTGFPKGCLLTHRYWQRMGTSTRALFEFGEDDTLLTAQPHSYIDPQWNVVAALQSGAHLVLLDGFHPTTLMRSLARFGVTVFYCLGVMPTLMLKQKEGQEDHEHSLKRVYCSGIPPQQHEAIEARWGVPWYEAFGMTETGVNIGVFPEDHAVAIGTGCIGRSLDHCEVSVTDSDGKEVEPHEIGEMRLRGLGFMNGYYKDDEATAEFFKDGWAHTGDLVSRDELGLIYYRGRAKEMIRRGGENIAPAEIETYLSDHPEVLECAVSPVPDDILGEEIKAYVVRVPQSKLAAEELHEFLAPRIARFKLPRYYEFRESLPHTPSEKVAKPRLEDKAGSWLANTVDMKEGNT
jgi:carnitine-CoA ligase